MALSIPIQFVQLCLLVAILMASRCHSWNINSHHNNCKPHRIQHQNQKTDLSQPQKYNPRQPKLQNKEMETGITRRNLFLGSMVVAAQLGLPKAAIASPNGIVTVLLESPRDSLGVEIYDTMLRGQNVVVIRKIVVPTKINRFLYEGMILVPKNGGSYYAKEFVEKLKSGPYPLEVNFLNLAAGGDAISDMGSSIVTPRDALELAQRTEGSSSTSSTSTSNNLEQKSGGYGITTLQQTSQSCAIKSRRNDVLEIEYEASYIAEDGRKVVYDASAFRGTGRPYQVVLGSGDMIPGVDQGIYDMCPGDKRLLTIPPVLGHGPKSRKLYMIPDNYKNLEWEISLVTIDSTITADNNNVSRDDREGRFAY